MLQYVARQAQRSRVAVETEQRYGEPAACLLTEARDWPADIVVLGRSERPGHRQPLGLAATRVLEFAEQPVLIVPESGGGKALG